MGFTSHPSTGLNRYPAAIALATISLLAGAIFTIKAPTTGLPPTGTVQTLRLQNGSGAQVGACFDNGNCRFSGSVLASGGVKFIGSGSGSSIHADSNLTSSGSFAVELNSLLKGNLTVRGTMSGASTFTVSPLGAATLTTGALPCIKPGGTLGWMTRTATGTLNSTCN